MRTLKFLIVSANWTHNSKKNIEESRKRQKYNKADDKTNSHYSVSFENFVVEEIENKWNKGDAMLRNDISTRRVLQNFEIVSIPKDFPTSVTSKVFIQHIRLSIHFKCFIEII